MTVKKQKILFLYLILSSLFLSFRIVTEVFQRYSINTAITVYLSDIDCYSAHNELKWHLSFPGVLCHSNYHYWSTIDNMVHITKSGEIVASIHGLFQAEWFGVNLKKVIIFSPINPRVRVDITEDFLSDNMNSPDYYFKSVSLSNAKKKEINISFEYPLFVAYFVTPCIIIIYLVALLYCGWIGWLSFYCWYLFFKTKNQISLRIRIKSYFYLITFPIFISLLIISAITAELGCREFFVINLVVIFAGSILYLIESVSVKKQYKKYVE